MKFEFKTEKQDYSKPLLSLFFTIVTTSFLLIIVSISIKLGKISKFYEINYLCNLLIIEKTAFDFENLSKLTDETNKQKIWNLCQEIAR